MRAPEVVMSSDSEVKRISLNKSIAPNTCKTTATMINAFDSDTIKVKKVDKSKINTMITVAEKKLVKVKKEISATNDELATLIAAIPSDYSLAGKQAKQINDVTSKLVELRKELQDARSEYYKLLFILRS